MGRQVGGWADCLLHVVSACVCLSIDQTESRERAARRGDKSEAKEGVGGTGRLSSPFYLSSAISI